MDRKEASARLVVVMCDAFDLDELEYSDDLTANDVEGWDSLSHVVFMVAVEREFGFRFHSMEIDGLKNLGEALDIIVQRATK